MYYKGVDPGKSGAIALVDCLLGEVRGVKVIDIPLLKGKSRVDGEALSAILTRSRVSYNRVVIEEVQSMPNEGHVGVFSFGHVAGAMYRASCRAPRKNTHGNGSRADMNRIWKPRKQRDAKEAQVY